MKKKILAALLSISMLISLAVPAFAQTMGEKAQELYMKQINGDDSISVLFNGDILSFEDVSPENIEERVMIPFGAVLEAMNANVEYDEATKVITATRNLTKITFSQNDSVINIDNDGDTSTLNMDVPIVVKDDRTLVPVRFISEAFGMNVGWDDYTNTVVIIDINEYLENFKTNSPNLYKVVITPANVNMGNMNMSIKFDMSSSDIETAISVVGDMISDYKIDKNNVMSMNSKINLDINDVFKALGASYSNFDLKDITVDFVFNDGDIYIKTNLVEKIAVAMPENANLAQVAALVDSDTWIKVNLSELMEMFYGVQMNANKSMFDSYKNIFNSQSSETSFDQIFELMAENPDVSSALGIESAFKMYEIMDKGITLTENKSGTYDITMKMDYNMIKDVFVEMMGEEIVNIMDELLGGLTFDLDMTQVTTDNDIDSKLTYTFGFETKNEIKGETEGETKGETNWVKINFQMDMTQKDTYDEDVRDVEVPEKALDLLKLLVGSKILN